MKQQLDWIFTQAIIILVYYASLGRWNKKSSVLVLIVPELVFHRFGALHFLIQCIALHPPLSLYLFLPRNKRQNSLGESIPAWDTDLMRQSCTTQGLWPQRDSGFCKREKHVAVWGTQVSLQPRSIAAAAIPHSPGQHSQYELSTHQCKGYTNHPYKQGVKHYLKPLVCSVLYSDVFSLLHTGDMLTQKENPGQDFLRKVNCPWILLKGECTGP